MSAWSPIEVAWPRSVMVSVGYSKDPPRRRFSARPLGTAAVKTAGRAALSAPRLSRRTNTCLKGQSWIVVSNSDKAARFRTRCVRPDADARAERRARARPDAATHQGVHGQQARALSADTGLLLAHFHLNGLWQSTCEWGLVCAAYHLRKLARAVLPALSALPRPRSSPNVVRPPGNKRGADIVTRTTRGPAAGDAGGGVLAARAQPQAPPGPTVRAWPGSKPRCGEHVP
jgi:hypothetical protein